LGVRHALAEEAAEVVMAADPPPADEDLGRRRDSMLRLERVRLLPSLEMMILDLVTRALQQVHRLQPVGTDMLRHHHAVDGGLPRVRRMPAHVRHSSLLAILSEPI